ncbi:MAG: hypothetical protein U9M90_01445 [Patescibacteria group bacterium]|nr:hypothetical protein [Patescibacteria group bacterium]
MLQEAIDSCPITPAEVSIPTEFTIPKFVRMLLLAVMILVLGVVVAGLLLYGVVGFFSMMHGVSPSHYVPMVMGVGMP